MFSLYFLREGLYNYRSFNVLESIEPERIR